MTTKFDLEALYSEPNLGVLATVNPDGQAHGMPIWYLYENGVFIISAGRTAQKVRNIERQGKATLIIDRRDLPYHAAMIQGRAEIGPGLDDAAKLRLATRYLGEERGRAYSASSSGSDSATITLHPDKVIEFKGAAGS